MRWLLRAFIVVFVLFLFVCFVLVTAPARLLLPVLDMAVPTLKLHSTHGTLWQGYAAQAYWQEGRSAVDLGRLDWRLEPKSLLRLTAELNLKSDSPGHSMEGVAAIDRHGLLRLESVEGYFPLAMLEPWFPLIVSGRVDLLIDELLVDTQAPLEQQLQTVAGLVSLTRTQWLLSDSDTVLGNYQAEITMEAGQILVDLADIGASLGLEGQLWLTPSGAYELQMALIPTRSFPNDMTQALRFIGQQNAEGHVQIHRRGRWR